MEARRVRGKPGRGSARAGRGARPSAGAFALLAALLLAASPGATGAQPTGSPEPPQPSAAQSYTTTDEYKLKAAYLFNFAKYVAWPAGRLPAGDTPIVLAVLGADPFGERLDRTVQGRTIGQHPVVVRRLRRLDELTACHILFIGRSERGREREIVEGLRNAPILTVSESGDFLERGGMIWLGRVGEVVEFDVNLGAARGAGLTIGARMLGSARAVVNVPDGRGR